MCWQTFFLFHLPINIPFLFFVFSGTLCSYNFHWFLTPASFGGSEKTHWSYSNRKLHLIFFIIGLAGAAYFGYQLLSHWLWLAITAFITFLYSAPKVPYASFAWLKKIAIGKTIFLAFAWTHIPFILPLLLAKTEWQSFQYVFVLNRFFLIYSICVLFDYRDQKEDREAGIKSMITYLSEKGIDVLFWGSWTVFLITNAILFFLDFSLLKVVILFIPGLLLAFLYYPSKKQFSDYYYYFVLDGLMMLSGLLFLLYQF